MSRYLDFVAQAERDYGVSMTPAGVRLFSRQTRARSGMTQRQYVGACRRIAGGTIDHVDHRLVGVGWNHVPPHRWIDGELWRFLDYWSRAVRRPDRVGSSHNELTPETVYDAMRSGIPPRYVRACGWDAINLRNPLARPSRRRLRRIAWASRFAAFRELRLACARLTLRARSLLGRFPLDVQRRAMLLLTHGDGRTLRVAEVAGAIRTAEAMDGRSELMMILNNIRVDANSIKRAGACWRTDRLRRMLPGSATLWEVLHADHVEPGYREWVLWRFTPRSYMSGFRGIRDLLEALA